MRKILTTLLFATLGISSLPISGCQNLTPEGRAALYEFGTHAGKELISREINPQQPNQTNVNVYNPPQENSPLKKNQKQRWID